VGTAIFDKVVTLYCCCLQFYSWNTASGTCSNVFQANVTKCYDIFIVSGLAQLFWVIPTIKRWIFPWYYIGIGGTIVLILLWIIAIPGSGYPIGETDIAIEFFQIVFIALCVIIIRKNRVEIK
jgi:hypothetical protein